MGYQEVEPSEWVAKLEAEASFKVRKAGIRGGYLLVSAFLAIALFPVLGWWGCALIGAGAFYGTARGLEVSP